jgi:hypothetical protein
MEDGFEEELRRSLGEFRLNIKKLLLIRNYRFKAVDPSPALPLVDSDGVAVWGNDPVHPLEHDDRLLVDLYIEEISNLQAKGGKQPGGSLQPPKKKIRTETRRQEWVENPQVALLSGKTAVEAEEAVEDAEDAAAREDAGSEVEATGEAT